MSCRNFVLVHGAWHGGWCWVRVAQRLRAAGHTVLTPTLTGLGERRHLISPQLNLDTHITDVMLVIEAEELHEVVLVGHSYGGIVISGVADRMREKLAHLVYLDATLLRDGDSVFSTSSAEAVARRREAIYASGGLGVPPAYSPAQFGVHESADAAWIERRVTLQPAGTYDQPLTLRAPIGNGVPRTYIECVLDPIAALAASRSIAMSDPGFRIDTLEAGHDAMISAPNELTAKLLTLA